MYLVSAVTSFRPKPSTFGCGCIVYFIGTIYVSQAKTVFILDVTALFHQYYLHHSGQNCIHFGCDRIVYLVTTVYIIQAKTVFILAWLYCVFRQYCLHHSCQNCIHFCLRMYCVFCWYYLHHSGQNYPFLAVMSSFLVKAFCYKCY